jgi:transaldolase
MKIFLDSAELEEIRQARSYGILDGVTTNPSLIKKAITLRQQQGEKIDLPGYIREILRESEGTPVSLEVSGGSKEDMVRQGQKLFAKFHPVAGNVWIKVPVDPTMSGESNRHFEGIAAIKALADQGIAVNCTLIFTPEQAMLAAKAGAAAVSPFAGRIDDWLRTTNQMKFSKEDYFPAHGLNRVKVQDNQGLVSGIDLVRQCVQMINQTGYPTQVLAASLRNARQVREAALAGAHIATLPFSVLSSLLAHEQTRAGMDGFTSDLVPEYEDLYT